MPLLVKHALIKGFLVGDYQHRQAEFINDVSRWLQEGKLKYKRRCRGSGKRSHAFIGLLQGKTLAS